MVFCLPLYTGSDVQRAINVATVSFVKLVGTSLASGSVCHLVVTVAINTTFQGMVALPRAFGMVAWRRAFKRQGGLSEAISDSSARSR